MFTKFRNRKLQTGAILDDRNEVEKLKDYKFEEMVASTDRVNWKNKEIKDWRKFPIFDQNGSGSCVAQTGAKMLGINYFLKNNEYVHFSATDIYQRRFNKPSEGMHAVDALKILTQGVTLEALAPSQAMTDAQMDRYAIADYKKRVGDIFKAENYVSLPIRDIETVASTIQKTGKGVMVWFYFTRAEWNDFPEIRDRSLSLYGTSTLRHSVTAVDFCIYKGKKGIIIEDSWGDTFGLKGQRFISEEFFNARNFFSGYVLDFKFEVEETQKPRYNFTKNLSFSPFFSVSQDVRALQDCLKYLGHFPVNIDSTGYFGSITRDAVKKFQSENKITPVEGYVGIKTRTQLNKLFG